MLGTDGRIYDSDFDFDGDGKLNAYEYSVMDDVVFGHEDTETSEVDELEDELSLAGLDATELEYMDADERREALEDAGLTICLPYLPILVKFIHCVIHTIGIITIPVIPIIIIIAIHVYIIIAIII